MIPLIMLLALQRTLASPLEATPLKPGQWVYRQTREHKTGMPAVSATLLSNDGSTRLIVRCDVSYRHDISIQILNERTGGPLFAPPARLSWASAAQPFPLIWERGPIGMFARDGTSDRTASETATAIASAPGELSLVANAIPARQVTATFDNRDGRDQLQYVVGLCVPDQAKVPERGR